MDIEGYAKRSLLNGVEQSELEDRLTSRILEIKNTNENHARQLSKAAIAEAKSTLNVTGDVLNPTKSGITMGQFGVGSRGTGDFYTHEKIAEIIGNTGAYVDSSHLDDSGAVTTEDGSKYVIVTVDGMHSRLSDFSYLAGFHVARAALRDIYVMGARPVALLSDIHVADDGDVAKIFDHISGITTVSELIDVPLVTGSTLRIGGDMVIGDRMTGGVGAVGVESHLTSRVQAKAGDVILMTEGAGGGTVSTTALYYGMHEVVNETINIKFLEACEALIESGLTSDIHAMTDVTNGGVRGDAQEISRTAGLKLVFDESRMNKLVNPPVMEMLESLGIDYLGVSLDSLLIISPEEHAEDIINTVKNSGVDIDIVGKVEDGSGAELIIDGERCDFTPRFRESAYTPIKKMVGEDEPLNFEDMKSAIDKAADESLDKKKKIIDRIKKD
ncbi:AIR synthase-related protein [Methanohalobium sp.]|uniref:AIR synthase-related protein n=1 Tax=Methanohalobium sp. TaxID=2837493 RepID=UPI0025ED2757|nr:AIR synthase-related protein [Methanohalobium sp.]